MRKKAGKPAFLRNPPVVRLSYLCVLVITYSLAFAFYPSISEGLIFKAYFAETYFGCLWVSVALSVIMLFLKPGIPVYVAFAMRCYVFGILGYSIGGYLSAKLVLGIGLMAEIGFLIAWPQSLVATGIALGLLALAQARPFFFGQSGLIDGTTLPPIDQLSVFVIVLALTALASARITRLSTRLRDLLESLRLQEANLDAMAELNLNLQGYARTVDEESSERERNRISREIHDISGYIFTNLIALMDAAGSLPRDDQSGLSDILITARSQAQEGLRETRSALRKLRSERTERPDSQEAIFKIVSIFRKITGIEVELILGNLPRHLSRELNLALYRTVQEALTNSIRHGKATKVRIDFWVEEGRVLLMITDNGKGAFEVVKGIGLIGMEERIGALGGNVKIGKAAEGGFSLSIHVPLSLEPETE